MSQKTKKLSKEEADQVINFFKNNKKSSKEIVRKFYIKERDAEIIRRYIVDEKGSDVLGKEFSIGSEGILKILKKNNIPRRQRNQKRKNNETEICNLYKSGYSMNEIAIRLKVSPISVKKIIEENKIPFRTKSEYHRKFKINESFFDEIDTEDKAYFLGILYADGYNNKAGNFVRIALNKRDKDVIEKLSKLIYIDNPQEHVKFQDRIKEGKGIDAYLDICSQHICEQLEQKGCEQAKTFNIEFPHYLNDRLIRHFVRGYFDGDGSVTVSHKKGVGSSVKLTSTFKFAEKLQNIIKEKLDINFSISENKNVYDLAASGDRNSVYFLQWLYFDSTIYMNRKYNKYIELSEKLDNTISLIKAGTQGYSKSLLAKHSSLTEIPYDENNSPKEPNLYNHNYNTNIIGPEGEPLSAEYIWSKKGKNRNVLVEWIADYYENRKFPLPKFSKNHIKTSFDKLKNRNTNSIVQENNIKDADNVGLDILKHFTGELFYKSKIKGSLSCFEVFNSRDHLLKVIMNRTGYKTEKEGHPYVYSINDANLIRGMISSGISVNVSQFKPSVAKYIFENYCPKNGTILDYSAGWGARTLAALSLNLNYIGIDPLTSKHINNMIKFLGYNNSYVINNKSQNPEIFNGINNIDLIFSCPPYFDREIYSKDNHQSIEEFSNYNDWLEKYWKNTVKNCYHSLKKEGKFGVTISSNLYEDVHKICAEFFNEIKTFNLIKSISHFNKNKNNKINEFIIIYEKK